MQKRDGMLHLASTFIHRPQELGGCRVSPKQVIKCHKAGLHWFKEQSIDADARECMQQPFALRMWRTQARLKMDDI
eukprot:6186576-Pleurochrysis_carterae.AAC.1